ncbi:BMC domain-containing protein [Calorimonas adulescens]|jgi:BMC domain.|uniref:BMC domain-containing protein n=1 Tax=Calorimonas adulescens TaxID=2606906 RepID=A0A5D8QFL8_9THEO|nr:BMC domain-containing protein [Calorimonas adulescens]TZE83009.1 BMC domain-containing protein [Calorimonas adulescens]
MKQSLGLIEFTSIAKGIETTDYMIKAANVELLVSKTICPGKYISLVCGDVDAVNSSINTGLNIAGNSMVDYLLIPNVHHDVIPAITGSVQVETYEALGVVECYTVASLIMGADIAAKASKITLIEIRVGMGIGGKSFFTLTGRVSDVMDSVEKAAQYIQSHGYLVNKTVIPSPHRDIYKFIL